MGTLSQTNTFTATDIRRVIDSFASDYWMISQSTGLRTRAQVDEHVADLKLFAEYGFLTEINLILGTQAVPRCVPASMQPLITVAVALTIYRVTISGRGSKVPHYS